MAVFGSSLPARIARSTGSVINVSTAAGLVTAVNTTASNGQFVNLTASITGTGYTDTMLITRNATAANPITITCDPGVIIKNFGHFDVRGSYLRFQGLEFYNDQAVNLAGGCHSVSPSSGANNIEIEKCLIRGAATNNFSNGIYVGSTTGTNVQVWDTTIYQVGRENGLDHGIYWSTSPSNGVIANCLIYETFSYGLQIYPNVQGLIMTCCTIDDGQTGMADPRGGVVIGDNDGVTTANTVTVGCLSTNAPGAAGWHAEHGGTGNNVYDCIGYNDFGGSFAAGWSGGGSGNPLVYTNCITSDPLYVSQAGRDYRLLPGSPAINHIAAAREGYIPPFDINGIPRRTRSAGCHAFPPSRALSALGVG